MNDWSHWFRVDRRRNRVYNKNKMCGLKNIGIPVDVPSSGATSRDFALAHSLRNSWGRQVASIGAKSRIFCWAVLFLKQKQFKLIHHTVIQLAKRKEYVIQLTNQNIK